LLCTLRLQQRQTLRSHGPVCQSPASCLYKGRAPLRAPHKPSPHDAAWLHCGRLVSQALSVESELRLLMRHTCLSTSAAGPSSKHPFGQVLLAHDLSHSLQHHLLVHHHRVARRTPQPRLWNRACGRSARRHWTTVLFVRVTLGKQLVNWLHWPLRNKLQEFLELFRAPTKSALSAGGASGHLTWPARLRWPGG
jgi:hypothetical protein